MIWNIRSSDFLVGFYFVIVCSILCGSKSRGAGTVVACRAPVIYKISFTNIYYQVLMMTFQGYAWSSLVKKVGQSEQDNTGCFLQHLILGVTLCPGLPWTVLA